MATWREPSGRFRREITRPITAMRPRSASVSFSGSAPGAEAKAKICSSDRNFASRSKLRRVRICACAVPPGKSTVETR